MKVDFPEPTPVNNLIEAVLTRPKMYIMLGTPAECICFLNGYTSGHSTVRPVDQLWSDFAEWLQNHFQQSTEIFDINTWNFLVHKYGNNDKGLMILRNLYQQYKLDIFGAQYVQELRQAAKEGRSLREIFLLLRVQVQPSWAIEFPIVTFEHFLRRAFNIPLRTLREVERWNGFSKDGDLSDEELTILFSGWIRSDAQN